MRNQKLGVCADVRTEKSTTEILEIISEVGFEAFFTGWSPDRDVAAYAKKARELGLEYQSLHAPYSRIASLWRQDRTAADAAAAELKACLADCARNEIGLMISHVYIGFDEHPPVSQEGLDRFGALLRAAEDYGVRIAFENTEGEEFLDAVLGAFRDDPYAGFCWDAGHEMCYNFSRDLLADHGDRLLGTHLNDNLGVRDFGGKITWHDDLHLLPYDGIGDWRYNAERLNACGYDGILTFELNNHSKPGRVENEKYARMSEREYLTEAYVRACRFAAELQFVKQRAMRDKG
ncbi:MAG: sugar phosphate isomerase/epimerase [Clostridia bacterium]|nr:sugar phosphate isomerase/epimerase [Clostridia bacterium]